MSTRLPQVVLKEDVNWTNITFNGRGFAWVNHSENRAMIKARHDERAALLATAPAVYEAGWATNSTAWVTVRLEHADPDAVWELLKEAWADDRDEAGIRAMRELGGTNPALRTGWPKPLLACCLPRDFVALRACPGRHG